MAEQSRGSGEWTGLEVAVIGMAGCFPGAGSIEELWHNLRDGVEAISSFTRDELLEAGADPATLDHPDYVRAAGVVEDADLFDAAFFGLTPRDAEILNPQHRVFLERVWEALENAGYDPDRIERHVGVFAGSSTNTYILNLMNSPGLTATVGHTRVNVGNDKDYLATGVSYRLNLRGPSVAVQSACSTSLVAVHLACQSLVNGECDLALAGGVSVALPIKNGYLYLQGGINSPDGHCRAFDAEAKGSVGGSGAGVVVLKRLEQALEDGDTIHAVIRGTAINNDGSDKVGFTAPSVHGQSKVIREALSVAAVEPESVGYVETHGTGTLLGDAIELRALHQVFAGERTDPCAIGSIKTNLGHLDAAAGVTGLIKAVLALKHGEIPPSLNCRTPHPEIAAGGGVLRVATELRPWVRNGTPRRAGVSSFGIGGTNAHAVLEEGPESEPSGPSREHQLLVLSARTPTALDAATERLADALEGGAGPLPDAAYTLQVGRRAMEHRLAVVCRDVEEAVNALRGRPAGRRVGAARRPVVFLFPGTGTQYVGMGRGLYEEEPVYREAVDRCCELLRPVLGVDLRTTLFAAEEDGDASALLGRTRFAQPAVFVTEYALAQLWTGWGIRPAAMIGHSLGEYAAACLAGVFRLEDALRMVALRALRIDELPEGVMLAVPLPEAELRGILPAGVDLAAVNSPGSSVAAGPAAEVEALEAVLAERGVASRRLQTSHAFHSRMVAPVAAELERLLAGCELNAPEIPFVSNVTGTWITDDEARSPAYWARHLCEPVRFAAGLDTLGRDGGWAALEVGPGQALGKWVSQHVSAAGEEPAVFASLRPPRSGTADGRFVLETLGGLWSAGVEVDWAAFTGDERRRRVALPTYPFERERFWVDRPRRAPEAVPSDPGSTQRGERSVGQPVAAPVAPAAAPAAAPSPARREAIMGRLKQIATGLTGVPEDRIPTDAHFLETVFDSLLLLQALQAVEKQLGVRVPLVQLLEEIRTLDGLADHLDAALPPEPEPAAPAPEPAAPAAAPAPPAADPRPAAVNGELPVAARGDAAALERIMEKQLQAVQQVVQQQLALLQGHAAPYAPTPAPVAPDASAQVQVQAPAAPVAPPQVQAQAPAITAPPAPERKPAQPQPRVAAEVPQSGRARYQPETFVPFQPIRAEGADGLTPQQQAYLDAFIARYVERTRGSREHQERSHAALADGRVTAKFRRLWKGLAYPIVGVRAAGSRVWDVDGNEYVDVGMSYGCNLFGHAPDFVSRAIAGQVETGYGLGPQSPLVGRAARLVCELGGNERAVFCNSGTEAVMGAIRAARTYTGRSRIAYFAGSYHGWSDSVLGRIVRRGGEAEVHPSAPGVPESQLGDVLMFDYDDPSSLEQLAGRLHEVALVLVEPVQSRRPDIQPRAFLHELRRLTREAGTLLLFDELVTGFRVLPGGAQELFGIEADLVTYGKVVAAGLAVGVVAGRREVMDVFDGGAWSYRDDSYPVVDRTFFAGAFFKHPLTMAVTCAVLEEVQRRGPAMFEELNGRTARLVGRMNALFEAEGYPLAAVHCGSVFRFFFRRDARFGDLLAYHLVERGVYLLPETGTMFLSTAHTDEDVETILGALRGSLEAMRSGGLLPPAPGGGGGGTRPAPPPVREVPVSGVQRQLWLESMMTEDASRAYTESLALHLHGTVDAAALARAVQALADRHATLRTAFGPDGDFLRIHAELAVPVPLADFTALPDGEREPRLREWLLEQARAPFNLSQAPLARFALAAMTAEHSVLAMTYHHVIVDGWSFSVLLRDLGALYAAFREGRDPDLPPVQAHGDAAPRAAASEGESRGAGEAYWLAEFADGVPVLELTTDRPRPPVRGYRGERAERVMDGTLSGRLQAVARRHGLTSYHFLLSAFYVWLGRLSGQEDVVVGVPAAGQLGSLEAAGRVGYAVNVLPLRARPEGMLSFVEHAKRVRRSLLGGLEHQDFSLPELVNRLLRGRDPSRPPLFSVVFNVDRGGEDVFLGDLRVEFESTPTGGVKFELDVNLILEPEKLRADCVFDRDLFDRVTIESWFAALERLLASIAEDPGQRLSELSLLSGPERVQVLESWNATAADYPRACLHELVSAQAARTPEAAAVVFEDRSLTYAELDGAANRLAHHLRGLGVGPEVRVGVFAERSAELVVALLGVLKAGGAYVPLDPGYPAERTAYMLEDSAVPVLLTQEHLLDRLPEHGARVVCLDGEPAWAAGDGAQPPAGRADPESLAYVIYTSGSTGRPKGAMNAHRGIVNRLLWMQDAYGLDATDTVLQKTPFSFDVSVWEFFWPLMTGARLVLARPEGHRDPAYLAELIERERVTTLHFVPPMLQAFLEAADAGRCRGVRRVVCSGEALPATLAERFLGAMPWAELHNLYGPTEAAVDVTYHACAAGETVVPIGRPVANTRLYVLDGGLNPSPVGVAGELYIGGVQVGRGYLGRAELTAERFVPDAFSGEAGARLYRTGDRARWLPGGEVEYLGRVDHQVKVRGFRVELGEIEATLLGHGSVREAVVLAREDAPGDRRLVAYVVAEPGAGASAAQLRSHLAERLPEHMVPGAYVLLDRLPVTANGKIDRRALPAPASSAGEGDVGPSTPAEELLAGIWAEVLGLGQVGAHADFFELGGHSLLGMRVVSRVRQAFGVELPLRALFEAPTVARLAERIEALLAGGEGTQAPPLLALPRDGSALPLSFAQQRLWFIDQLEPRSAAYNMPFALRLRGRFDPAVLERAVTEIVRRHETLRTVFATVDGEPVQVVRDASPVALPIADLRGLPADSRKAEVRRLARDEAARPFDLAAGPLLRLSAVRLDETEWGVLFTMHHIVSDAWSTGILVREVSALYDAVVEGGDAGLPELPVQYADYAAWQRGWLTGDTLEAKLGYWRDRLAGAPPLLELPTDRVRPQVQDARGGWVGFALSPEVASALRALSRREGTTLFMTLLAGWQLLLSRYSGQEEVVVGTPTAGRTQVETEALIGFFVNTLVLRTDLSGEPTFRELLGRVREATLGAYAHQEVPFERLVEELVPERSMAYSPLFQVMFALQNVERGELRMGALEMEPLATDGGATARFDVSLSMTEEGEWLGGGATFRSTLFDASTIQRMLAHYAALLEAVAAEPGRRCAEASFLPLDERAQVLQGWNATDMDYPQACVHELFERQVELAPHAVAVVYGTEQVSYAELNRRANRLAHHLVARGVGADVRVGICVERSVEMVVALLAVLKAGGAYVALDPQYPQERLRYMLADSAPAALLTQASLAGLFAGMDVPLLAIDEDAPAWAGLPESDPPRRGLRPEHLVYVIYTSGSTGQPKGVMNVHRNLVNRICAIQAAWRLEAHEAVLQNASLSFDVSAYELFWPLMLGARVVMTRPDGHRDPAYLLETIRSNGIGTASFVPSSLQVFLEQPEVESCTSLLRVPCGGEALPGALVQRFYERLPGARLYNRYGPSEAATAVTGWSRAAEGGKASAPIGRPMGNTRVYVLDRSGEPAPVGAVGELYIGGAGVGRGYLGQAVLTAERFVPDAFGAAGERLYQTGDLARWLSTGELEFLGRGDTQVKVRGFRVELGEIEAQILEHPEAQQAVVLAREDSPGDKRLVAYYVGAALEAVALRTHLSASLPEYMVPAAFVRLDRLPLTPNGKIDRRALPVPEWGSEAAFVPPNTQTEEILAGIWGEVLRVERVGVEASFFELGGHSLLATQVISRARHAFGVEVPLRALFEAPTVAALAGRIEALRGAGASAAPPIERVARTGPLPLSFAQQRLWFIDRLEPGSVAYNMPDALRLRGVLDTRALRASQDELVRRHEALRTTFAERDGRPVQVVHAPAPVPLAEIDLRNVPEAERYAAARELAAREALRPFDLARGPLLRSTLLRLADDDHVLCFTLHHIVSDGWSMQVLVREVSALYAAFSRGETPRLPELAVQYADYAVWQRRWLAGEVLAEQIAYWKERLSGAPPLLEIPLDRPRAVGQSARAASRTLRLPPELSQRLRALSQREGVTLFMALLAGWQVLLGRYAGQEDMVVGSPIAGRNHRETEGLVGFFVNMLALRADLSADPTWRELLGRVREEALGAYDHQDLPFERLVEELSVERSLTHAPVFQVAFELNRAAAGEALRLGDLRLESFGGGEGVAKFDLHLMASDFGDFLGGELVFRAALFEAATIARMTGHLEAVLEALSAEPGRRVSELSLLRPAEREQVVEEWNRTERPYPREVCVHELFEAQVRRAPDAAALVWEEVELTYAQLDARANRLAHHLRGLGVGPESRVGVLLERGVDLVVSILAVLKAGGAYVPLDPGYPAERLRMMLEDSSVRVLLSRGGVAFAAEAGGLSVVLLDEAAEALARESADAPRSGATAENLAYIVYTSGSTGRPKGVMVAHRHVVQLVVETDYVRFQPGDRVAQASNASFDALTFEAWGALMNGATLVGIPRDVLLSPAAFRETLREQGITTLYQTTALLNQLSREQPDIFAPLREVLFGGQAVDADSVRRLLKGGKPRRLLHMYGPTETTAWCSYEQVEHVAEAAPTVAVGGPTGNQRIYLLDPALEPVPTGVPGEAYVGGGGVVRGYLDRPGLTAERFLPDPFATEPGTRMYRTGDRLRWKADGKLEFIGRVDEQVKIRGFRIEPGEVESAVAAHPGVREARVIVREDTPGEKRLVAYLVGGVEVEEVRAYLRQNLPEYMVPGGFVVLESLPLTRNGKLDVRALPAPEYGAGEDRYVAPRTATEDVLAGIWAEVLGLERVGVEEGFFDLGGHSLLATRVVARARQAFGMEVPLRALFEAPTVAALAARIEALRTGGGEVATPIVRIPREGVLPLSFAQQRLWFLHQIDPRSVAYNVPLALRFRGELDTLALERSFGEVVRRHEVLRTVFRVTAEGEVEQVVEPAAPARLARIDLAGLPNPQRERELRSIVREEAALPFDLKRGPLFRTTLIRAADDEHVLLLTMHHVVTDGWSTGVLTREFSALYPAFREGRPSPLPELPIQYADYAVWQQEWLRGETLERHLAYWTERLSGAPELLEIPTDHPRPATMSFRGAFEPMHLPSGVVERLEALARGEGATLYMVVLGAFQVLLGKYAGSEDVVVGSTIAGRTHREVEPLIGLFMNTLVLRVDLAGDPGFREVLRRVREAALGAYEHQAMPFEKLVQELRPERSLSHTPVFQVLFELHTSENGGAGLPGLRVGVLDTDAATSKFDLSLTLTATSRGLSGGLVYSTDLFERGTARRIVKHLERVLRQVVGDPDRRLSGLELMGRADRAKLAEWNRTAASYPAERCIHQLFEAQAENTPDAVAVTFEERALTYRELDRRANRLAHHLAGLGVGPEVRVGLCLERSLEVMVAILGVLKAGGAYVPMDASHPAERLAYVLEDSGVAVLLTQDKVRERLPVPEGVTVVTLDPEWEPAGAGSAGPPESGVTSENLCYVIYTSGSTGRPKGVAMHHRGVCNYIDWGTRAYGADQGTGAPVFTSMAVDLTITNLLPLFAGRSVRLLPEENAVEVLAQVLRERPNFGLIKITPVHLGLLNTMLAPEHTREAAHTLVIGADFLSAEPTLFWQEHAPGVRLMNEYGPTETVVGCSAYVVPPGRHRAGAVPVGPPIQNLAFHVLDAQMGPVPVGLPGELYIGGAGVARGYLGRPGLSAEKFLPDPFAEAGARMYRTGDRARWLQDGNLLILGRTDNQVKIRGFRVELGEIEAALRRREELRECLVVVREDRPGDRRLVAYVVADPETTDPAVLRDHLRQSLPEYMVPGAFVVLESLPHTPTGKLDPRMLPAPSYLLADMQVEEPANYVEAQLIQVWESLLGIDGIGPTQSFFDLGGNSFLALRLFTQVNQRFDCDLPVATLFAGATVRHMAAAILEQKSSAPTPRASVVPLQPHGSLPPLFLVHSADRNVVGYVNLVRHLGADQPVYGVRDVGEDLSRPVVRIAAEHVAAIREVQPRGPYYLASWSFGGIVAFEMALQLEREGETVAFVGLLDTIVPTVVMEERVKRGADLVIALAEDDAARARLPFALRREDLEGLDLDAQIRRAAEALHPGEPALQELEAAVLREAYHTGQDRIRSRSGYVPGHFSGTLTLFRVSELTEGYQEFLASSTGEERHTLGWAPYTENPVEVHLMPGQHATLASEPHVRVLAQSMREALDSARLRAGHEGAGETRPEPSPHLLQRA